MTPLERLRSLRNLETGYDLVAAVGFLRELHGENLIDEYEALLAQQELAWAAGFFDGEGTVSQTTASATRNRYLILRIGHVDPRPLRRFAEAVGLGNVNGPYQHRKGDGKWSDFHTWQVAGSKAEIVFSTLLPFLSLPKVEQYDRVKERIA